MPDITSLKQRVLGLVRANGPVLPVQVSKEVGSNTLFVGAMFSELISNKQIKISHAKVGGSPLYYVDGQESKLEKLYEYLPGKEKEAYTLLKKYRILIDTNQEASIRVALRNLKDFAMPVENDGVLFWRWYLISEQDALFLIDGLKPKLKIEPKKEEVAPIIELKKVEKVLKPKTVKSDEFLDQVKTFLSDKNVKILNETILRKSSDIEMKVKIPSNFGDLDFFLKAKNKKRIGDNDLILAHHKGQKNKMPTLFLSNGSLTKKAEKYVNDNLKGFLIFRNIEE